MNAHLLLGKSYLLIIVCNSTELRTVHDNPEKYNGRRVLKELEVIKRRLKNNKESVFSFLIEGDESVILPMFKNRNTKRLDDFTFFAKNDPKIQFQVADHQVQEFDEFIDRIAYLTKVNNLNRSSDYLNARESLDKLLNLTNITVLPPTCLVKTDIYEKIIHQEGIVYFVVGRKGAGKSTLVRNFISQVSTNKYKQALPISAESFQHEMAYSLLYLAHEKDSQIISPLSTFELFWRVFIAIHCIVTIGCEIEVGGISPNDQRFNSFNVVCTALKKQLSMKDSNGGYKSFTKNDGIVDNLFRFCVEIVEAQFNNPVNIDGTEQAVYPAFSTSMNVDAILINIFGEERMLTFADGLQECKKRIIISLDGFDDHSEQFRTNTMCLMENKDTFNKRVNFDKDFFRALLNVAQQIKENENETGIFGTFGKSVDFCIVLPNDRYSLIMSADRDATKKKFVALMWDAYELLQMVVKRLEYLGRFMEPKIVIGSDIEDPFDRFNRLVSCFRNIPNEVEININGQGRRISLFNYLLRYSFWRPRDIISNLNSVMSAVIEVSKEDNNVLVLKPGEKLTGLEIRTLTKTNIEQIYKTEFISEFKNVYTNLSEVLDRFRGKNVSYSLQDIKKELDGIYFTTAFANRISTFEDKMKTLYRLGVIGIRYPKNSSVEFISKTCFIFNAGMVPMEDLLKGKKMNNVKIVFNPLIAYCQDMFWNSPDIVGNWTNDEIISMHRLHSAVKGL